MLYWALVFLVVAIIAAVLGFAGVATAAAGIAKILFYIFLISLRTLFLHGAQDHASARAASADTAATDRGVQS